MQFAGPYLLWYSGVSSAILALDTGAIVDISGSLAAGDDLIVLEEPTGPKETKGQIATSRVGSARASALTSPGDCPVR